MSEVPASLTTLRADIPTSLASLVMSCLAKDPKDRPQKATDIARMLETINSGDGMLAMPPVLLGGPGMFKKALLIYVVAVAAVALVAKAAIVGIGLPEWVFPGALTLMALGLPVVLWTGYVQRVTRRAMTTTYTPGGTPSLAQGPIATMALKAAPNSLPTVQRRTVTRSPDRACQTPASWSHTTSARARSRPPMLRSIRLAIKNGRARNA